MKTKGIILEVWNIIITASFYLLALQMYLMTDKVIVGVISLVIVGFVYLALRKIKLGVLANKHWATTTLGIIILLHIVPLIKQLLGVLSPTVDTIILGVVALALLIALHLE